MMHYIIRIKLSGQWHDLHRCAASSHSDLDICVKTAESVRRATLVPTQLVREDDLSIVKDMP